MLILVRAILLPLICGVCFSQVNVLTQHNDNNRTGANLNETVLNTSNVNTSQFGMIFTLPVDAQVYAQPLYASNVTIPNMGTHNVLYVATENNTLYAFDADTPGTPLWQKNLGTPNSCFPNTTPDLSWQNCTSNAFDPVPNTWYNMFPLVGITATPVIDPSTGTIYVVNVAIQSGQELQFLHAIDITTGAEKFNGPVEITGTVPGNATGGTTVTYNPVQQRLRPGLTLMNGLIVIAVGAYSDFQPYHGWVFSYNASTLQQVGVWNDTPNATEGGIWTSGGGLVADASGNIYLTTGNGSFDGVTSFGMSVVKLGTSSGLSVLDYFAPFNQAAASQQDLDLGVSGPMAIPGTKYLVNGSKTGILYLLDTTNLGKFNSNADQVVQEFQATTSPGGGNPSHIHGGEVYWNGPAGQQIYLWGAGDHAKAFLFNGSSFQTTPASVSTAFAPATGPLTCTDPNDLVRACMPGGFLAISANGSQTGTGILWASTPYSGSAEGTTQPGILHALDASNLANELWNSKQTPTDDFGYFAKYVAPTVANGKVYMATFSNEIAVYGLSSFALSASPSVGGATPGTKTTFTVSLVARGSFTGSVSLSVSGLPTGATATFSPSSISSGTSTLTVTAGASTPIGTYYLTITGQASGLPSQAVLVTFSVGVASATFSVSDSTTQGNWMGVYGADGANVVGDTAKYPAYASVAVLNQSLYTWASSTTDVRALERISTSGRIAAAWYNGSQFTIDVSLLDGNPHQVALYFLDWDNRGRSQSIQVLDATSGTILDTRNIASFTGGQYLVWSVVGHVQFKMTRVSGDNAVVSGIFFASAGVNVSVKPSSVNLGPSGQQVFTATVTGNSNQSVTWSISPKVGTINNNNGTYTAPASITSAQVITVTAQSVAVSTAVGTATVNLQPPVSVTVNPSSVNLGSSGQQVFTATVTGNSNQSVTWSISPNVGTINNSNGTYTAPASITFAQVITVTAQSVAVSTAMGTATVNLQPSSGTGSQAQFIGTDSNTQGNWKGVYGADGANVIGDTAEYPSYATVTPASQSLYVWASSTTSVRSLQKISSTTDRIAAAWYGQQFTIDVNLTDGNPHQVACYYLDVDSGQRSQTIQVVDASSGTVLDTRNVSSFTSGQYFLWTIVGHVVFKMTVVSGANAVVSGIFFASSPVSVPVQPSSVNLGPSGQQIFTAEVIGNANQSVTWSINPNVGTMNNNGTYTAPASIPSSQVVTVTAQSVAVPSGQGSATVNLQPTVAGTGNQAQFVKIDTTTQGNWKGTYGSDGFNVIGDTVNYPSYATVTTTGQAFTWASSTSDIRALQKASSTTDRIAATWYAQQFTINVTTDSNVHQIALYCLDFDTTARAETINVVDATTGAILNTQSVSNFNGGKYVVWNISGHVIFQISLTAGPNSVVSGIFFH